MTADPLLPTEADERWAAHLTAVARALPYPPMPAPARVPRRAAARRPARVYTLALAAVVVALLAVALLAVPSTRAGLLEFIQIGVVRLQLGPSPTPTATPTEPGPAATPQPAHTPPRPPPPTPLSSVLDLAGATTLAAARAQVDFAIRLPTYPADLGEPDEVFLQDMGGAAVVLVWRDPADPAAVRLSLHLLAGPMMAEKLVFALTKEAPPGLVITEVDSETAVWTTGPYLLHTEAGGLHEFRLIEGHVLIWTDGFLTYRLETRLPLAEAQRVAESLAE